MIVTEAEAREKLCLQMPSSGEIRRIGEVSLELQRPAGTMCQGSKCMAWRWHSADPFRPAIGAYAKAAVMPEIPTQYEYKGYCGLAGKP